LELHFIRFSKPGLIRPWEFFFFGIDVQSQPRSETSEKELKTFKIPALQKTLQNLRFY
jgi:hypothetical protein